ncbi:hypothetical protein MIND_00945200 [Mycena indigotica]|uniref:Uncharacterized protein n=1 Tax=Mycena indigotica TaxID=2126181 RepID=A0A8H6W0I5_9AGAR|nr:uncharacterized protein MIND_00945200 [Mycena indigotica]KAF7297123.1 hypothetical protein MIND_00945200 [Mycena indigotica]
MFAMFSVSQPKTRSAPTKPPRNFAVRVFKGPAVSTVAFPHTATGKFDAGYRPTPSNDPRQPQSWYNGPTRQPAALSIPREPLKAAGRFVNATPHPSAPTNYADFIYERSLSSKSDIYSDESPSTSVSTTPTSLFSPAFSANSSLTSTPSEGTVTQTTTSSRPNAFPLNIPALSQAQSAVRNHGLFAHPNDNIQQQQQTQPMLIPATRAPDSSPPRIDNSPVRMPLSESPQDDASLMGLIPPPRSEAEATVGESERLALRNAQMNAAGSAYYQAGFQMRRTQSRSSSRSPERTNGAAGVYESSSIVTTNSARTSPTIVNGVGYAASDTSSVTIVDSQAIPPRPRVDSLALSARHLHVNIPVSQLVELGSPEPERERLRIMTAGEELRGLNMNGVQREVYNNTITAGTHHRMPPLPSVIPAVVRSDSGDDRVRSPITDRPLRERERRSSGNLWGSSSQTPDRRSPIQTPARPSSTPPVPLPRIDTSAGRSTYHGVPAAPPPTPASAQQSPTIRRDSQSGPAPIPPPLLPPPNGGPSRVRTPVAGPRAGNVRRRSDGDEPVNSTVAGPSQNPVFQGHKSPPGALPLEPQRRRSVQSVVPPPAQPQPPASRNVRWTENLVCPSPIFASQRRKGWWNRRGDQLWTNDGAYKPVPKGFEFPNDLRDYPEYGTGWMNEDGVRIDMGHRLIPKVPLRSALKQPRGPVVLVNPGGP